MSREDPTRPNLPLVSLKAFEAAARHGNFRAAAEELRLTPSAVSHQIRQLELRLQRPLFKRGRRGVELTSAGRELSASTSKAFNILRTGLAAVSTLTPNVRLSAAPVFARRLLLPNLQLFERSREDLKLQVDIALTLADVADGEADIGLRFGSGRWPDLWSEKLMDVTLSPVCVPGMLPKGASAEAIADQTLISIGNAHDDWDRWFAAAGRSDLKASRQVRYDSIAVALDAARHGLGVTLAPRVFVEEDLISGALIFPSDLQGPAQGAYYFTCRRGEQELPNLRAVRLWLKRVIRAGNADLGAHTAGSTAAGAGGVAA